jgi:hypothetical protein
VTELSQENHKLRYLPDLAVVLPQPTNRVAVVDPSANDQGRGFVRCLLQRQIVKEDHLSLG